MSSRIARPQVMRSAAWRVSLWASLAFACGTMLVFAFLHHFVSRDIQLRSDAWLSGEVAVLGDVAERTPKDRLYGRVVGEVAELATREVPNRLRSTDGLNDSVFFIQSGPDGALRLWVGKGNGAAHLDAIRKTNVIVDTPSDVRVQGFPIPFRVASTQAADGSHIYLGLSERDERLILRNLRFRFFLLWLLIVFLGFAIVFYVTRRVLGHIREITDAASRIGQTDLSDRVPTSDRHDEVAHLALTLNGMLDRIENSMNQLHTITDSLAHDLRSPLTAIRGKLEMYLSEDRKAERAEPVVSAIDELDRLTEFLNKSLDVAEARADALRLSRSDIDLDELLRVMIDLYEPSMIEKGLIVCLQSEGATGISADAAMMHRMISNLFDNEWKHLPDSCMVSVSLNTSGDTALLMIQDDGPGFGEDVRHNLFKRRAKGTHSTGHGLGLAFVDAVVHAHGGTVTATNGPEGGAQIVVELPLKQARHMEDHAPLLRVGN
jgi:signal transduction histidine kinase